jgi:hypothetical protein
MANFDHLFPVRRGRPRKYTESALKSFRLAFEQALQSEGQQLTGKQKSYLKEIYTPKLKSMISHIPKLVKFPYSTRILPLLNSLEEVVKRHMLNELELAYFCAILQQVPWKTQTRPTDEILDVCGFFTKTLLESDARTLDLIGTKLRGQYKNLDESMQAVCYQHNLTDVNTIYTRLQLCSNKLNVNYNYYVDEIVRTSPPYQVSAKKPKKEEECEKQDECEKKVKIEPEPVRESEERCQDSPAEVEKEESTEDHTEMLTYEKLMPLHSYENYLQEDRSTSRSFPSPFYDSEVSELELNEEDNYLTLLALS